MGFDTTYTELRQEVAFLRGWGRDSSGWSQDKIDTLEQILKQGLHRFLFAALLPKSEKAYEWSFLRQVFQFGTVIGQTSYDLPADYGTVEGWLNFGGTGRYYRPIPLMNQAILDKQASVSPDATGYPRMFSVRAKRSQSILTQQWEMVVFPKPDAVYQMKLPYRIVAVSLSSTAPYLPGGATVARAAQLACHAQATFDLDNSTQYEEMYSAALVAAISFDSANKGVNLGYNGDPSMRTEDGDDDWRERQDINTVTSPYA